MNIVAIVALAQLLDTIDPKSRSKEFYIVKATVKSWGHWKDLPRGKPRSFKE
jgi:hypothetical protein